MKSIQELEDLGAPVFHDASELGRSQLTVTCKDAMGNGALTPEQFDRLLFALNEVPSVKQAIFDAMTGGSGLT